MTKTRWRKEITADGVVTHTDPAGRVVIEKHTHHYGPWLVKDLDLDERVAETEVSEAEAKRLAEDYLASPRPVPPAPSPSASRATATAGTAPADPGSEQARRASMAYAAAVHAYAADLRALAREVERMAVPDERACAGGPAPHARAAAAVVTASGATLSGPVLASLLALAGQADVTLDRLRREDA